jgi:hypothetical protein
MQVFPMNHRPSFRLFAAFSLSLVAAAAGCSSEDKQYKQPIGGATEQRVARGAIDSVVGVGTLDNPAGAFARFGDAFSGMVSLSATKYSAVSGRPLPASFTDSFQPMMGGSAQSQTMPTDIDDPCVIRSGDTVRFNRCQILFFTLDGRITANAQRAVMDIHFAMQNPQTRSEVLSLDYRADVRLAVDRLTGTLAFDLKAQADGGQFSASSQGVLDVLLTGSCPTGGSLESHTVAHGGNGRDRLDVDVWVKADFGPSCGQVTIR